MKKIAFFDTKQYDRDSFDIVDNYDVTFFDSKLNATTAKLATGFDAVVAFVNDTIDKQVIDELYDGGVRLIAMRCAGYNNVDFKEAYGKINVVRVPGYSPYAVAEHAMALLLCLNRKIHKAYLRTRDHNFNLVGLTGFDLHGKTAGVIGTGKIGRAFIDICNGFGMKVLASDPYKAPGINAEYVEMDELLKRSDIISLHCPLTKEAYHMIDGNALKKMKTSAVIVNTSRGALIDSAALLDALKDGRISGAALDVYEEESDLFFEDRSEEIVKDDILALLIAMPNVIVTSHQAFLTREALRNIADTTMKNIDDFFAEKPLENEVCYYCMSGGKNGACAHEKNGRCF